MPAQYQFDVLIIGSGIAGLSLALHMANHAKVGLITKSELLNSSSQYAQGGVAAVTNSQDFASHITDTLNAGGGLCDEATVAFTVEQAPKAIQWLIEQGVAFTRDPNNPAAYHLTREGGHSCRRIYHVADSTGAAIIKTLVQQVLRQPKIHCLTDYTAIDLLVADQRCFGATVVNKPTAQVLPLYARATVVATGGASAVYLHTSNPKTSSGDGLAMAWRAGCRIANLEFNQFHPTSLYHPQAHSFLVSEALRGEGAILRLPNGYRFMPDHDPRAELAPRDIVARAITLEMQKHQLDYVLLDISHKATTDILRLFPMIAARCQEFGYDLTSESIPVVPAAHYTCGGIMTDHSAHTDLNALYAIGEAAHTGLHGANRMASNSLLECLVFAASAGESIRAKLQEKPLTIPPWLKLNAPQQEVEPGTQSAPLSSGMLKDLSEQLRLTMSTHLNILRSNQHIQQAWQQVNALAEVFNTYARPSQQLADWSTLRNRIQVAKLMIRSTHSRKESRGCHFNMDYPLPLTQALPTILTPANAYAST